MSTNNCPPSRLSEGALNQMVTEKHADLDRPLLQVLSTKQMANNRLRAVINDGIITSQHCIFLSNTPMDAEILANELTNFSVVRFDEYSLSELSDKGITVIMVPKVSVVVDGGQVSHRLAAGETFGPSAADEEMSDLAVSPVKKAREDQPQQQSPSSTSDAGGPVVVPPPTNSTLSHKELANAIARHQNVCPISVITPYFNAWAIRGLVACKSPLKTYNNARSGPGKLFSFNLIDDSGEIRITAFNKEVDRCFDLVKEGEPLYVCKGNVKHANKKYCNVNHEYELTLVEASIVEPCQPEEFIEAANGDGSASSSLPKIRYQFKPLAAIEGEDVDNTVDIIGVIRQVGEVESFVSKRTNKEIIKRDIFIVDSSLAEVKVTIFGEKAISLSKAAPGGVLAVRGGKVGTYGGGKNVASTFSSLISLAPDIPEATLLQSWYATESGGAIFNNISRETASSGGSSSGRSDQPSSICQISPALVESHAPNPLYVHVTGLVMATNNPENHLYKSCSGDGGRCSKKVEPDDQGSYRCNKCGYASSTGDWKWRLLLSLRVNDATGPLWVTVFQENAERLLGKTADELARLRQSDPDAYRRLLAETVKMKLCAMRVGVRIEEWSGERRTRAVAYTIKPVEAEPEGRSRLLLSTIQTMAEQLL